MIFSLVEAINKYYRFSLINNVTKQSYSFFIELGKYLKKLYNEDNEIYDDFNYAVSKLEYVIDVPAELDFKNKNYNFAFTKNAIDTYKEELDDVAWYIHNYSPYEIVLTELDIDDVDIVYKDDLQIAYEV